METPLLPRLISRRSLALVSSSFLAATLCSPDIALYTIINAVGVEAESDRIQKLLSELEGKDLASVIAEGKKQLASMPAGGGAAPAAAAAAPAAGGAKKEEKPESDEDMGFSLFD